MSEKSRRFHIHGDNIVECERTLHLIEMGFKEDDVRLVGPLGVPTNPEFILQFKKDQSNIEFVFFPGFGRWDHDIKQLVLTRGGILNESADAILSKVESGEEEPLLAIEYSGALSAGNQAWQRSGRAYSFGLARIPYLYVAELGGYELGSGRSRKSPRFPNPAIPFSFLSFGATTEAPVLPIFVKSPVADAVTLAAYETVFGETDLAKFIRLTILGEPTTEVVASIEERALSFVRQLSRRKGFRKQTLTPEQWSGAYQHIKREPGIPIVSYLEKFESRRWSKTASIKRLTDSAKRLMQKTSELAVGLTSTNLPLCLIPPNNRLQFANLIRATYPGISREFSTWLEKKEHLVICWVMGFKPKGDDARPDRGLPPLARMLIGPETELLTIVYGPAPQSHWTSIVNEPQNLAERNGLWQSILAISDAILIDSDTDNNITDRGYTRSHWQADDS